MHINKCIFCTITSVKLKALRKSSLSLFKWTIAVQSKGLWWWFVTMSSLLALQPCLGLGLLHGLIKVKFFRGGVIRRPTPNPQPGGPGTTLRLAPPLWPVWHGWSIRSLCFRQHSSVCHWSTQTSSPQ
jgi:hypothetical protein